MHVASHLDKVWHWEWCWTYVGSTPFMKFVIERHSIGWRLNCNFYSGNRVHQYRPLAITMKILWHSIRICQVLREVVKSGSTPVGGPVSSGWKRTKGEGRGLDKRLVRLELATVWIQRLRTTSVDPLCRFRSRRGDRDRDRDGQDQE